MNFCPRNKCPRNSEPILQRSSPTTLCLTSVFDYKLLWIKFLILTFSEVEKYNVLPAPRTLLWIRVLHCHCNSSLSFNNVRISSSCESIAFTNLTKLEDRDLNIFKWHLVNCPHVLFLYLFLYYFVPHLLSKRHKDLHVGIIKSLKTLKIFQYKVNTILPFLAHFQSLYPSKIA